MRDPLKAAADSPSPTPPRPGSHRPEHPAGLGLSPPGSPGFGDEAPNPAASPAPSFAHLPLANPVPPPLVCVQRGEAVRPAGGQPGASQGVQKKALCWGPWASSPPERRSCLHARGAAPSPRDPPTTPRVLAPVLRGPGTGQASPTDGLHLGSAAAGAWCPSTISIHTPQSVGSPGSGSVRGSLAPGWRLGEGKGGCGGGERHPQGWGGCRPSACGSGSGHTGSAGRAMAAKGRQAEGPGQPGRPGLGGGDLEDEHLHQPSRPGAAGPRPGGWQSVTRLA